MAYKSNYAFDAAVELSFPWHVILIDMIVIELIVAKIMYRDTCHMQHDFKEIYTPFKYSLSCVYIYIYIFEIYLLQTQPLLILLINSL